MKNRYLLLITLIFGLTGQMAQAMSQPPSNPDLLINKHLSCFKLALERTGHTLNKHVAKYHPGFILKWFLSKRWEADDRGFIGVPLSFILNNNNGELATVDHEIEHILKKHILKREKCREELRFFTIWGKDIFSKKNQGKYYKFIRETEREADEGTINNHDLLFQQGKRYEKCIPSETKNHLKNPSLIAVRKSLSIKVKEINRSHPSFEERAARFNERYTKLTKHYNDVHFNNQKVRQFFGVPRISGTSPREAARVLGLDQDYYPNLSSDMFKPTNLARYSFSRNTEFLKPRVVRAIE